MVLFFCSATLRVLAVIFTDCLSLRDCQNCWPRLSTTSLRGVKVLKLFIGLGIPYLGVVGLLPWVASVDRFVLGVPFIYAWIFAWFILTSGCLMICWRVFDCRHDESHPQNR
jgi:hypothetical protein